MANTCMSIYMYTHAYTHTHLPIHTHNTLTRHIYIHTYKYICIHEGTYVHTRKVGFFVIMFAVVCSDSEIHGLGVIPNLPVLRGKNLKVALFPRSSMILCFLEPWGGRNSRPCREMPLPVAPRFFWGEGSQVWWARHSFKQQSNQCFFANPITAQLITSYIFMGYNLTL